MPRPSSLFPGPSERLVKHAESAFEGALRGQNPLASPLVLLPGRSGIGGAGVARVSGGMQRHHVSMTADTSQTLTGSADNDIMWDTILGAPAEQEGIWSQVVPSDEIACDLEGGRLLTVALRLDAVSTFTAEIVRDRAGTQTVLDEQSGTGDVVEGTVHTDIAPGDLHFVRVNPSAGVGVAWGRVQVTDLGIPTSVPLLRALRLLIHSGSGTSDPLFIWTVDPLAADTSFSTNDPAEGCAWDGVNIWTVHGSPSDQLKKWASNDGTSPSGPVLAFTPSGLHYDTSAGWFVTMDNLVPEINWVDGADGSIQQTLGTSQTYSDLTMRGSQIWGMRSGSGSSHSLYRIDPSTGAVAETIAFSDGQIDKLRDGIAWDNVNAKFFVAGEVSGVGTNPAIIEVGLDGTVEAITATPSSHTYQGLAFIQDWPG